MAKKEKREQNGKREQKQDWDEHEGRRQKRGNGKRDIEEALPHTGMWGSLKQETRYSILGITFGILGVIFLIGKIGAGGAGEHTPYQWLIEKLTLLFGIGYYLLPMLFFLLSISFFRERGSSVGKALTISGILFILSGLGLLSLLNLSESLSGGVFGKWFLFLFSAVFGNLVAGIIMLGVLVSSLLILFDAPLHFGILAWIRRKSEKNVAETPLVVTGEAQEDRVIRLALDEQTGEVEPVEEEASEKIIRNAKNGNAVSKVEEDKVPVIKGMTKDGGQTQAPPPPIVGEAKISVPRVPHVTHVPPPMSLLSDDKGKPGYGDIKANANTIKRTLQNFGVEVEMDEVTVGPSVTRYSLKPADGLKLSRIVELHRELSYALAADPIRIEAPIPGKSLVGIEIPNTQKATVGLASLLQEMAYQANPDPLYVPLGKGISGHGEYMNIARMPHILVAGATGSGKSVTIHTIITSLLYRNSPAELRFIMIDPKRVELTLYNGIPHLLTPVITDAKKTILTLKWATKEMERRYDVLERVSARDIGSYHKNTYLPAVKKYEERKIKGKASEGEELPESMPYIVIIIDELADLMHTYPRELEGSIVRLAQMSRAVGIHLILATQRPSVNVITGLIKANVPARVALQVASQIDSRTILDQAGAEKLLGQGDMLFISGEMSKPKRIQSAFISEAEVKSVVKFIKEHSTSLQDDITLTKESDSAVVAGLSGLDAAQGYSTGPGGVDADSQTSTKALPAHNFGGIPDEALEDTPDEDEFYGKAKQFVIESGKASTSMLQRRLGLGYARAARIIDMLEQRGVVSRGDGAKPREVLIRSGEKGSE